MTAPHSISSGSTAVREAVATELIAHGEFSSTGNSYPNALLAADEVIKIVLAHTTNAALRTAALPSVEVEELAAWLCALEDAECHEPVPESLIEHGRMYIRAGMTEKHCGDCTNQSHSCVVCGTDGYLLHARQIIAALASSPSPQIAGDRQVSLDTEDNPVYRTRDVAPPFSRWADIIESASLAISPARSKELDALAAEVRNYGKP